jgi:hypothetical protein
MVRKRVKKQKKVVHKQRTTRVHHHQPIHPLTSIGEINKTMVIVIISVLAVAILGLLLFFSGQFTGKAVEFIEPTIGGQAGLFYEGEVDLPMVEGESAGLPVQAHVGASAAVGFSFTLEMPASVTPVCNGEVFDQLDDYFVLDDAGVDRELWTLRECQVDGTTLTFSYAGLCSDSTCVNAPTGVITLADASFMVNTIAESYAFSFTEFSVLDADGNELVTDIVDATFTVAAEDVCDATHLDLCVDQAICESAGLFWYDDACQDMACTPRTCVYQDYAGGIKECGTKEDGCGGTINCDYQAYAGGLQCPLGYECVYQDYAGGIEGGCVALPGDVCDATHLDLCVDQATCETAGLYWFNDACLEVTSQANVANICGDVDDDGQVTTMDVGSMVDYITAATGFDTEQIRRADVNEDGLVNVQDTILVVGYLNTGTVISCEALPAETCSDTILNQDETAVDCGGVCGACAGDACTVDADCAVGSSCTDLVCTVNPFQCTGTAPLNAELCVDDDQDLTADTPMVLVGSCTATKCQYSCATNFHLDGFDCVADDVECTLTAPLNGLVTTDCTIDCSAGYTLNADGTTCDLSVVEDVGEKITLTEVDALNTVITATEDFSGTEVTAYTLLSDAEGKVLVIKQEKIAGLPAGGTYTITVSYPTADVASKDVFVQDKLPDQGWTVHSALTTTYP